MSDYDLLIVNGLVATHEEVGEFDIAVKAGKIAKLLPRGGFEQAKTQRVIDARGGCVMVSKVSHNDSCN